MKQPTHHQIAAYLTDYVLGELVKYVMEDEGCSVEQAMVKVFNSPIMEALEDVTKRLKKCVPIMKLE